MSLHATPSATPSRQIDSLQILRAVAALFVFVFHYFGALQNDFGIFDNNPFPLGAFGVDIFFVVSGFIICFASQNETSAGDFFLKRLCRIVPLYWLLTLGVFAVALVAPSLLNSTTADWGNLMKSLAFIPYQKENGLLQPILYLGWTLNYEMFFYLIFALSIYSGRYRIWICMSAIIGLVLLGVIFRPESDIGRFYTSGVMLNFVWGCVAYLIWYNAPALTNRLTWLWPVGAALLVLQNFLQLPIPREFAYGLPSMLLLLGLLTVRLPEGAIWQFVKETGDASYSLYLVHPYIIQLVVKLVLPVLGVTVLSIAISSVVVTALTVIASLLLFRLFEKPSNVFLRNMLIKQRVRSLAAQAGK
ncbi:acyltransferase family protein [Hyphomonas neptunium ATCC 15444]|uniref:Acyltransferase family protein n=2 Tax=Hyphomonas TaxID=85 RepID=Q0C2X7_HYPNA|nr:MULTISPECIES: acyltransferase [Hyphomonas]ABI75950.1 acyltransferase family protein [Hyphomonas neptunium ATCC 15444]KCZ95849.1 acyltransferase family protein [Hyphomonas hirschiana VP5]